MNSYPLVALRPALFGKARQLHRGGPTARGSRPFADEVVGATAASELLATVAEQLGYQIVGVELLDAPDIGDDVIDWDFSQERLMGEVRRFWGERATYEDATDAMEPHRGRFRLELKVKPLKQAN